MGASFNEAGRTLQLAVEGAVAIAKAHSALIEAEVNQTIKHAFEQFREATSLARVRRLRSRSPFIEKSSPKRTLRTLSLLIEKAKKATAIVIADRNRLETSLRELPRTIERLEQLAATKGGDECADFLIALQGQIPMMEKQHANAKTSAHTLMVALRTTIGKYRELEEQIVRAEIPNGKRRATKASQG